MACPIGHFFFTVLHFTVFTFLCLDSVFNYKPLNQMTYHHGNLARYFLRYFHCPSTIVKISFFGLLSFWHKVFDLKCKPNLFPNIHCLICWMFQAFLLFGFQHQQFSIGWLIHILMKIELSREQLHFYLESNIYVDWWQMGGLHSFCLSHGEL